MKEIGHDAQAPALPGGGVVVNQMRAGKGNFGFDAATAKYTDLPVYRGYYPPAPYYYAPGYVYATPRVTYYPSTVYYYAPYPYPAYYRPWP